VALGFVLVKVEPGREHELLRRLVATSVAEEIFPLFGEYDFILKVAAADFDALGQKIVSEIRSLPGLRTTLTFTVTSF
jgi:DNA-binding Lrp family transcriptional regulator